MTASERELKIAVDDAVALRRRLREQGARRLHPESFEDNVLWDRGDELARAGAVLRLRTDGRGSRLTFKGPASFDGPVKVRAEHETQIDGEAAAAILESLGYRPVLRYQKLREEWELDGVVVAVDRTPMGEFAEFEGAGARRTAERCGCDPERYLRADYPTLWRDYRERHPGAPEDMVFDAAERSDG